jgi:beta-phosphoglucomutase-like phosphatase (HAD superfamily)
MGIEAAHAAGMRVVALTTSFQASHFEQLPHPPAFICADFEEFLNSPAT